MRVDVTHHAVERFFDRIAPPGTPPSEGAQIIARAFEGATRLRQRTVNRDEQWKVSDPRMVLVVARDGGKITIKTILGPNDAPGLFGPEPSDEDDEELEEAARRAANFSDSGDLTMVVRVEVRWRHVNGDRAVAEGEVRRRVAKLARRADGSSTGCARIVSVKGVSE